MMVRLNPPKNHISRQSILAWYRQVYMAETYPEDFKRIVSEAQTLESVYFVALCIVTGATNKHVYHCFFSKCKIVQSHAKLF